MATAYSDDLRRKLLEAPRRGAGSLAKLAERFGVSLGWALKISATLSSTGKMERPAGGKRGPTSKVTAEVEQDLRNWIRERADLTLAELQLRLYEQRKLEISLARLWQVLGKMGLRLKKSRSTPPSRTPLQASSSAVSGVNRRGKSIRRN